jgi:hypothetical protein
LPAHSGFEEKLTAARRLRDELGITRPILVDDIEGTVHHAYGLLPNMSWVLERGGSILYKAMWTSAAHVGDFLEAQAASPPGPASGTFYAEQLGPIVRDRDAFYRGLERNGPRAGTEFARAEQIWTERVRAARRAS